MDENGTGILAVLAVPAVLTVAAFIALHEGGRAGRAAGWLCVFGLVVLTLLGLLGVGPFILPVAGLVAYAAAASET